MGPGISPEGTGELQEVLEVRVENLGGVGDGLGTGGGTSS